MTTIEMREMTASAIVADLYAPLTSSERPFSYFTSPAITTFHCQLINQSNQIYLQNTQTYGNKLKSTVKHKGVVYRTPRQV